MNAKLRKNIKRIMDLAHGWQDSDGNDPEDLHQLRVSIKKIRAWLRLLPRSSNLRRAENTKLKAVSRKLSPYRDRDILIDLAREKHWPLSLVGVSQNERKGVIRYGAKVLEQVCERLIVDFPVDSSKSFKSRIRSNKKKVIRLVKKCLKRPAANTLHSLRKRCKDVLYEFEIIEAKSARFKSLKKLSKSLGNYNDLDVASRYFPESSEIREEKRRFRERIHSKLRTNVEESKGFPF